MEERPSRQLSRVAPAESCHADQCRGLTPQQVAVEDPMVYFVHFRAIDALYDALRETIPIPKSRNKL